MTESAPPTRRPAKLEDLLAVPEDLVGEIMDGELVVTPQLGAQGGFTRAALLGELDRRRGGAEGGGSAGWWIFDGPRLRLGANVLVPDLTGWRRQRMPRPPQNNNAGKPTFELPPDWACEVLSPSTAVIDRTRKLDIYARHGVCWLWLVDAVHRTVEVLWLEGDEWVIAGNFGGDQRARLPPFDSIELELAHLWEPTPAGTGASVAAATVASSSP
jgi:Uma2 family endonuclease